MKPEPSIFDEVGEAFDARREAEARADIDAGRVVSHDAVSAWPKTWGKPDEELALKSRSKSSGRDVTS